MPAPKSTSRAERSRYAIRLGIALAAALGLAACATPLQARATTAHAAAGLPWPQPPPVLPLPSRSGAEGPPRPYGFEPHGGPAPAGTPGALARRQSEELLEGPFPAGGLQRGVSDGALTLSAAPPVRALAMRLIAAARARVVRIAVDWRGLVAPAPPAGFRAADPGDPSYRFAALDATVQAAVAAGLQPMLVVSHAPAFAEAPNRWPYAFPGSWDPDPDALRAFAEALARRYSGGYSDPSAPASTLPRVALMQAWNEPNLAAYLEPQWVTDGQRWVPFAPVMYRSLLNAFYEGIKAVAPGDEVIAAGLAPSGDPAGIGRMAPVTFLDSLLCLAPRRRREPSRAPCPEPAHLDVLAFHPLSVGDPDRPARSSLDLSVADAAKVTGVLARAEQLGTIQPAGRKPVWVTEINWEGPPAGPAAGPAGAPAGGGGRAGVPPRLQAAWVSRALHRLWVAGVSTAVWEFLMDAYPGVRASTPTGGLIEYPRPAGLYAPGPGGSLASAVAKPFLAGFALPFDPLRVSARAVRIWAIAAPAPPRAPLALQRELPDGSWRTIELLRPDADGIVNRLVTARGRLSLRLRERDAGLLSAVASVGARRFSEAASPLRVGAQPHRRAVRRPSVARGSSHARPGR